MLKAWRPGFNCLALQVELLDEVAPHFTDSLLQAGVDVPVHASRRLLNPINQKLIPNLVIACNQIGGQDVLLERLDAIVPGHRCQLRENSSGKDPGEQYSTRNAGQHPAQRTGVSGQNSCFCGV